MDQPISQTASPAPGDASAAPSIQPMQDNQSTGKPVEFDVHIKSTDDELQDAIAVLKEAGLNDIAMTLEKALGGQAEDPNAASTQALTDEISAMDAGSQR